MVQKRYIHNPNIVSTEMDDEESVLLDLTTRRYFTLNPTGAVIWERIVAGDDLDAIVNAVTEAFEIDAQSALPYVELFLSSLEKEGLISISE